MERPQTSEQHDYASHGMCSEIGNTAIATFHEVLAGIVKQNPGASASEEHINIALQLSNLIITGRKLPEDISKLYADLIGEVRAELGAYALGCPLVPNLRKGALEIGSEDYYGELLHLSNRGSDTEGEVETPCKTTARETVEAFAEVARNNIGREEELKTFAWRLRYAPEFKTDVPESFSGLYKKNEEVCPDTRAEKNAQLRDENALRFAILDHFLKTFSAEEQKSASMPPMLIGTFVDVMQAGLGEKYLTFQSRIQTAFEVFQAETPDEASPRPIFHETPAVKKILLDFCDACAAFLVVDASKLKNHIATLDGNKFEKIVGLINARLHKRGQIDRCSKYDFAEKLAVFFELFIEDQKGRETICRTFMVSKALKNIRPKTQVA